MFRFGIFGAAKIAHKFCEAAVLTEGCEVCAVASKSLERAEAFAKRREIAHYYDSYKELLEKEHPDCVYIAVTTDAHYALTMLCIEKGIPVLCEKAMFRSSSEAEAAFAAAEKNQVFIMEAMWSRFLPAIARVKSWLQEGRIGKPVLSKFALGFAAEKDPANRFWNRELGGGAAFDLTVYAYELTTYLLEQKIKDSKVSVLWSETGVDASEHIVLEMEDTLADLTATFSAAMEEKLVIYGETGKIIVPRPHTAANCMLYDGAGVQTEYFEDTQTENGFVYEIKEVIRCIREGRLESDVIPWRDTASCAKLFDRIWQDCPFSAGK